MPVKFWLVTVLTFVVFGDLDPFFRVIVLYVGSLSLNLHGFITKTSFRADKIFNDFGPIFSVILALSNFH